MWYVIVWLARSSYGVPLLFLPTGQTSQHHEPKHFGARHIRHSTKGPGTDPPSTALRIRLRALWFLTLICTALGGDGRDDQHSYPAKHQPKEQPDTLALAFPSG